MTPNPMEFLKTVQWFAGQISYKPGWSTIVGLDGERVFIQVSVNEIADASLDSVKRNGTRTPWKGGKRFLSPHMCRQEIVGAFFDAFKSAELHEIHEWFRYRGASIFNPHIDPDALVEIARLKSSFNVRDNAMTMDETPQYRFENRFDVA